MALEVGEKAPAFEGLLEDGSTISSEDLKGSKYILYFYPADDTPTCTNQACNLRDEHERFVEKDIRIFGVSPDGIKSHNKFIAKYDLPFSLIADEDRKLCELFDVWGEKTNFGRTYMGVKRTSFLIDESGVVQKIVDQVKAKEHADQLLD